MCQSFQLRKNYCEKVNTVCKQTKFNKQEVAVFDSSKQSEAIRVKYERKCKNSITPNLQNVHKHEDCINERLFSIKTDQTAVKHKKQKKRGCSLTGEQEMLATILQINPNARQNISLVRHGSLPPLRLWTIGFSHLSWWIHVYQIDYYSIDIYALIKVLPESKWVLFNHRTSLSLSLSLSLIDMHINNTDYWPMQCVMLYYYLLIRNKLCIHAYRYIRRLCNLLQMCAKPMWVYKIWFNAFSTYICIETAEKIFLRYFHQGPGLKSCPLKTVHDKCAEPLCY